MKSSITESDSDTIIKYYERRKAGQTKWINKLQESINDVSKSEEYQSNGSDAPIALTTVLFSDVELVGVPALAYLARSSYNENPSFAHLMDTNCKYLFKFFVQTQMKFISLLTFTNYVILLLVC